MSAHNQFQLPRQITDASHGHILTNTAVWSPDGEWLVYDIRSDPAGSIFNGKRIERVHVDSGRVEVPYERQNDACCGVATYHPSDEKVVFILGPEHPNSDWQYSACHRQGMIVNTSQPQEIYPLDARDLTPPFTPGALRGGTHVHVFSRDGKFVSFTYDDHILTELGENQRNIGMSLVDRPVIVPRSHPRNHDGTAFSVLVTKTVNQPQPGSDEICRAYEDAWIGSQGYVRSDGSRQTHALAFLGDVITANGQTITELFAVDLPQDMTVEGTEPLAGTETRRPAPPLGTMQRRLTYTADRKHPGLQGPRHWPRSSPDGSQIAFLMRDDNGHVQLWTISPNGGLPRQITHQPFDIASAFTWHPNGVDVAATADGSVWLIDTTSRETRRLTRAASEKFSPLGEACVFSPDGRQIAYVQPVHRDGATYNQIFVVETGL
ncbi:MAG: DUF3748 domain-containing protein [Bythopirellula sp.]|nr:DUF3748 domain-containing protein [Bythopirellula sp.]